MVEHDAARMTDDERDEFLDGSGTGVISLSTADDEPPHTIPVSYGYDPVEGVLYFRLATDPDREKGKLADRAVTFVVYGEDDERWKSVAASGRLVPTTDETVSRKAIEGLERISPIPIVDIFGEPTSEVEFEFYRLDPERFTSRVERPMEP